MSNINNITKALAYTIAERQEAEVKEKALKQELLGLLNKEGKDVETTPDGTFTVARRPSWEYPETVSSAINEHQAQIADIQEQAQFDGSATKKITEYVLYKPQS